jgi:CubicO group peptidase (beta-lactamase class C family)
VSSVHAARFLRLAFAAVFCLTAFGAAADSPPPQALTAANIGRLVDRLMTKWVDDHKGPGAVVVVVTRDGPVFARGYGFADAAAKTPLTADATLVRPGSISKLFTGIAVMQLVDAGKLDLDRDVNAYIDFAIPVPEGGVPVTLRRLLKHRAGFEEHLKGLFSRNPAPEPLGRWLAENLPRRLFPNGDVEAYSNYGAALAGYVVERVSGEPFGAYAQRHILDPLGMRHSTFQQPLPDNLAPLIAKGYRTSSDAPPLAFFETISGAPAGALSASGEDMGRFMRALINGGELDGVRILPKARLDEMMTPSNPTPVGYLGLAFFDSKILGHDSIGHDGQTMTFFSDLRIFPERGIGIFVSRDGMGEITTLKDLAAVPNPMRAIVRRFLPEVPEAAASSEPYDASIAGVYHSSRRADSSFLRVNSLVSQRFLKFDGAGNARSLAAIWPFGEGRLMKRLERNLYEMPDGVRYTFIDDGRSESYFVNPAFQAQRVPWYLDARWIAPAFLVSTLIVVLTLLAWPVAALWRRWRKRQWNEDSGLRRYYLAVRLVLLVDTIVICATATLFIMSSDYTIFNAAMDPLLVGLYALAWLGAFGALLTLWAVISFWRNSVGSRWSRVHYSLVAASSVMIAWFFITFRIAGTTLNY